ncbi:hypothetical protein JTE90_026726 [Oedothorax gibbosus]|uniref:Kielin/chordin-like protein n=1 Tax=Oedothorax gibbosus TaxID=931172 RepID=A0AAV6TZH4_9ARAC|nr:hypothetical protein JTE90_026726 [Oedothorax gibbosus]
MKFFVFVVIFSALETKIFAKSLKERSVDETAGSTHTCDYDGHSYALGASLPTGHLCLDCKCTEDFVEASDRHCQVIQCPQTDHLDRGCLPVYNATDCCPSDWNCDGASEVQTTCDPRYFKHYLAKGCEPVYEVEGAECPSRFSCPTAIPEEDPGVCTYKDNTFEIGKRIRTSNPCERCYCRQGWDKNAAAEIVCAGAECFGDMRPLNDSCYQVFEQDHCCSSGTQCVPDDVELKSGDAVEHPPTTCEYGGRTYHPGQRIYPDEDPCLVCTCGEGWTGDVQTDPHCRRHECTLERKLKQLRSGCIPIYHEATCCPIELYCGENYHNTTTPLATPEEIDAGKSCDFKGGHYSIGQVLDIAHPTHCVTCRCSTPPDFTCVHKSCPRPSNPRCVSSYVPGSCCPKYDCPESGPLRAAPARAPPSYNCSPVKCPAGCTEVTVHNSCSFCKCATKVCAPPKCDAECTLEAVDGGCPTCKCAADKGTIVAPVLHCSPVKCPDNCYQVTPSNGCPVCACGPLCTPPKCDAPCRVTRDVNGGECPACEYPAESGGLQCSPVQCPPGCKEVVGEEGCPSCNCPVLCSPPKCDPGCQVETTAPLGKCPGCVCAGQKPAVHCSPVNCGPLCHEAYDGVNGCPTCICDPVCSPPVCTEGCHLEYNPSSGPCPHCACGDAVKDNCPRLTCGPGCHKRPGFDGCPTCECGPQCAAPKCDGLGCHLEFDMTAGPCAACVCTGDDTNRHYQCATPMCASGCTVDYSTSPCPSCNCNGTSGIGGVAQVQCSPPNCDAGCRIDYTTKPCPSCSCVRHAQGSATVMCSPPKCEARLFHIDIISGLSCRLRLLR